MQTYYYNKNSSKKVLHLCDCHYITNSSKKEYGEKHSIKKAVGKGYTLCKHCFALQRRFKSEMGLDYRKNNYKYNCTKVFLEITTAKGNWKVLYAEDKPYFELYHQNKEIRSTDSLSRVPGYHFQNVREYDLRAIIQHIREHDGKVYSPPAKGTKRFKKTQKRIKVQTRKDAINNVLNLIDGLQMNRAV